MVGLLPLGTRPASAPAVPPMLPPYIHHTHAPLPTAHTHPTVPPTPLLMPPPHTAQAVVPHQGHGGQGPHPRLPARLLQRTPVGPAGVWCGVRCVCGACGGGSVAKGGAVASAQLLCSRPALLPSLRCWQAAALAGQNAPAPSQLYRHRWYCHQWYCRPALVPLVPLPQTTAEDLEYSELLDEAATYPPASTERLLRVAAFAIRWVRRRYLLWLLSGCKSAGCWLPSTEKLQPAEWLLAVLRRGGGGECPQRAQQLRRAVGAGRRRGRPF